MVAQTADLGRKRLRQHLQLSLEGTPSREATVLSEQGAQCCHFGGGLFERGEQFVDLVRRVKDYDDQRLQEAAIGKDARPARTAPAGRAGYRQAIDGLNPRDKERASGYHRGCLRSMAGLATSMIWGKPRGFPIYDQGSTNRPM